MHPSLNEQIWDRANIHKNYKQHSVIVIDGIVGSGKSIQTFPIGWLHSKYHNVPFGINNYAWNVVQYIKKCRELPDFSCVVLDEGVELHRGNHMSQEFKLIRDLFWTIRSRRLLHIICLKDFSKLPYDLITDVNILLHCDYDEVQVTDEEGSKVGIELEYSPMKMYSKHVLFNMWKSQSGKYPNSTSYKVDYTPYNSVLKIFDEQEYEIAKRKYLDVKIDKQIQKYENNDNKLRCPNPSCSSGQVYKLKSGDIACRQCGYRGKA